MNKTTGAISSVLQNSIDDNSRKGSGAAGGLIWGFARPDQGLRLVNSRGGQPQCSNATGVFAPAIASYDESLV
jgi:hypothetical protein